MFKGPNTREFQECIVGINIFNKSTMGMKDSPYSRKQKNEMGRKISQGHIWGQMWLFPKESYICELSWLKIYHFKYIFYTYINIYYNMCNNYKFWQESHFFRGECGTFLEEWFKAILKQFYLIARWWTRQPLGVNSRLRICHLSI